MYDYTKNSSFDHANDMTNDIPPVFDDFNKFMETVMPDEMNDEDKTWIEDLFQRIVEPIIDFFDGSNPNYDSERIFPGDTDNITDRIPEEYNITEAVEEWHVQNTDYSCAVCSQQFIINEFLDLDMTEQQLCTIAQANGWLEPNEGTSPEDADNLLELFGIDSHMNYEGTIVDIRNTLNNGGRVIAAVDSAVLWTKGFGNYPIYGTDHAVEVIGLDESDPYNVKVILNDSGTEDGCGKIVSINEFIEAWNPSGGFMISAFPKD